MPDKAIVVTVLARTGLSSPSQWEGETSDGRYLYVRYRWGFLSIGIGHSRADSIEHSGNLFEEQLGHGLDGSLELEELRQATKELIEWPSTYLDRPAEFREVDFTPAFIAGLEKMAGEYEERAKTEPEVVATQLREEAKLYREQITALKTRKQVP